MSPPRPRRPSYAPAGPVRARPAIRRQAGGQAKLMQLAEVTEARGRGWSMQVIDEVRTQVAITDVRDGQPQRNFAISLPTWVRGRYVDNFWAWVELELDRPIEPEEVDVGPTTP